MKILKLIFLMVVSLFLLGGCSDSEPTDIVNPDANFQYFYGKTCPHCIEMNKYLSENDVYSLQIIEKKEVWNNKINARAFQQLVDNLGIPREEQGVPFFYDKSTQKHYVGVANIIPVIEAYKKGDSLSGSGSTAE